ncbi:MAG TPA: hypothetical protein VH500_06565 [Nitrososphaeraceae archaeon]
MQGEIYFLRKACPRSLHFHPDNLHQKPVRGIVTSYLMNLAPGGTIVIISVAGYLVAIIAKYMFNQIKGKGIKLKLEKSSSSNSSR